MGVTKFIVNQSKIVVQISDISQAGVLKIELASHQPILDFC